MNRYGRLALLGALTALALTGCAQPGTRSAGGPSGGTGSVGSPPPVQQPSPMGQYKVTYPFGVPSTAVTVSHPLTPPIANPPEPPLPYLVGIYVGDHPTEQPAYQRISFYYRGAFPSYTFNYVPSVLSDAQGAPIPLQGNAFLRVVFKDAQAHNDAGSTIASKPPNPIGFKNLKSYGFAGDFEGHVTYGLGLQTAANSDQVLKIRAGELKKPDGSGGYFYVVHFDVQTA